LSVTYSVESYLGVVYSAVSCMSVTYSVASYLGVGYSAVSCLSVTYSVASYLGVVYSAVSCFSVYVKRFRIHPVVLVSNIYVNKSTVYTTVFMKFKK
jgi:hypothetical protein